MADAIIAKAKSIYGKRLTSEDYNNLLHRGGVSGVVAYLKTTERYRSTFANVNETQIHRGQVEQLLSKELFELYRKLCKFMTADKSSFCHYKIKELEIRQIVAVLTYIKARAADEYIIEMPAYIMGHLSFDLMKLSKAKDFREIPDVLIDTPYYKVIKPYLTAPVTDINECAVALYAWYIKWAFKAIDKEYKGAQAKSLKEIFLRQADLSNIMMCYRKKSLFNEDAEEIKKSLNSYHYLVTPELLDGILSQPDADKRLLALLKKVYFKNKVECDPQNLETAVRKYRYSYYKKQLSFSRNGTIALYSLMCLCEIERNNLQTIIESARYNRAPEETEKLLVM